MYQLNFITFSAQDWGVSTAQTFNSAGARLSISRLAMFCPMILPDEDARAVRGMLGQGLFRSKSREAKDKNHTEPATSDTSLQAPSVRQKSADRDLPSIG